jgi:transaldolase
MPSAILRLHDFGQSPWYDNLTRALATGGLNDLIRDHGMRGVTSNPTIFEKAMTQGTDYDEQLKAVTGHGASIEDAYWDLVLSDIGHAADILRPIYDDLHAYDGYVSVEVSPLYANDTAKTIAQAKELWARVNKPNVMIKIPATLEGLPAITEVIGSGINVNVTLIFSLERYKAVAEAYVAGLEQAQAAGHGLSTLASVASFFVSRVDTETDKRLPDDSPLRGKAAVANAKLAYVEFTNFFAGPRWKKLEDAGAKVQRPLWASTSTKNKAYSPTLYVDELVGEHTVNTLAQASVDVLAKGDDSKLRAGAITEDVDGARKVFADLQAAGVDFDDVTATLEKEGVDSFAKSFTDVLATLGAEASKLK